MFDFIIDDLLILKNLDFKLALELFSVVVVVSFVEGNLNDLVRGRSIADGDVRAEHFSRVESTIVEDSLVYADH